ncbi:LicD family protein [Schinkia azotoformans]|uniref:LicD family protein n=1 Tax=Schinkia azotoformans TaxID=1454 RepID=UPI002DBC9E97|nr:LicD family protein [Schinkia azotoformans]MEC1714850.1 LicD family protein [Schinkia azotoformans]
MVRLKTAMASSVGKSDFLYNLNDAEREGLKKCLLEMYKDVAEVCSKYGLTIMLGGGSVLGAVRHKGFIPWDDDMDLNMERKDYLKLISIFNEELSDKYYLAAPSVYGTSKHCFARIYKKHTLLVDISNINQSTNNGVYLDIFPLDYVPNSRILQLVKGFFANALNYISLSVFMHSNKNDTLKKYLFKTKEGRISFRQRKIVGAVFSFISYQRWVYWFDMFVSDSKKKKYCTFASGRKHYLGELMESEVIFPVSKAEFEGIVVNIPNNVNAYLTNLYGDYMKVPPVEKRERHYYVKFELKTRK